MDLNLFRQDIKKICLLIAFQQSFSSGQKTADVVDKFWKKIVAATSQAIKKPFIYFFALIFFTLTLATTFVSASFLPKVSKVKERG